MAKGDSDEEEKDPASKPPSFAHAQRETRLVFQAPKTKRLSPLAFASHVRRRRLG